MLTSGMRSLRVPGLQSGDMRSITALQEGPMLRVHPRGELRLRLDSSMCLTHVSISWKTEVSKARVSFAASLGGSTILVTSADSTPEAEV